MKTKWISLRKLKIHEFMTTLRIVRSTGASWSDIFTRLGQLQSEATKKTVKSVSSLLFLYLVLVSFGDAKEVTIAIKEIKLVIPSAHITVTASILLFLVTQNLQNTFMLITVGAKEAAKMRIHGFSSTAFGQYLGQDNLALTVPILLNPFFKPVLPISKILIFLVMTTYLAILIPIAGLWVFLLKMQVRIIGALDTSTTIKVVASAGVFILFATALFLFLFNAPQPYKKSAFSIRWGFLTRLYSLGGHPRLPVWLDEKPEKK